MYAFELRRAVVNPAAGDRAEYDCRDEYHREYPFPKNAFVHVSPPLRFSSDSIR